MYERLSRLLSDILFLFMSLSPRVARVSRNNFEIIAELAENSPSSLLVTLADVQFFDEKDSIRALCRYLGVPLTQWGIYPSTFARVYKLPRGAIVAIVIRFSLYELP